jgi:superfamily II DNA/RNA helicase
MTVTPAVLVLAPTRELATQIQAECERFAPVPWRHDGTGWSTI